MRRGQLFTHTQHDTHAQCEWRLQREGVRTVKLMGSMPVSERRSGLLEGVCWCAVGSYCLIDHFTYSFVRVVLRMGIHSASRVQDRPFYSYHFDESEGWRVGSTQLDHTCTPANANTQKRAQ